jgi:hypothetical protein
VPSRPAVRCPAGTRRFAAASPCIPLEHSAWRDPNVTRHHQGFTHVHPSGLPLACGPRTERGPLGVFSELRTPPLPAAHVRAGTGLGHWPGITPSASADLLPVKPLNLCDLVPHRSRVAGPQQDAQRLSSRTGAVIGECGQGESAWGAVQALRPARFPRPLTEPAVRLSTQRALRGRSSSLLGPGRRDRPPVSVARHAYLLQVEQGDPASADRFPPAIVVGQVPAHCGPPPAVPGLQPPHDPPPQELVQMSQGVRADGMPEVPRSA